MTRALLPGRWNRDKSRAVPLTACTGNCNQGRACTCVLSQTELANELGPDDTRVIAPPMLTPDDAAAIARIRRWTLLLIAAGFAVLGALLGISDARFSP